MAYINITKENSNEFLTGACQPVLLDFWAPWCVPCRQIASIVEEIGSTREDILVGKVNVDEEPELAQRFRVMSIPTLVVCKDGKITARAVGFRTRDEILKLLEK